MTSTQVLLEQVKSAKKTVNTADSATKNRALAAMADALLAQQDAILAANRADMAAAATHLSPAMLDRLRLNRCDISIACEFVTVPRCGIKPFLCIGTYLGFQFLRKGEN